jgi:excisionase family DNA binding protein
MEEHPMRGETKTQIISFLDFQVTKGELSPQEYQRLRETLEGHAPSDAPEKQLTVLTRSDVAKMLKVSSRTVDRMCLKGELKFFKLGPRHVRFKIADVFKVLK